MRHIFVFLSTHRLRFTLNGSPRSLEVRADRRLIDVLRDDLGCTGTKEGCSIGVCGACSVLVAGELLSACLLPAVFVDAEIRDWMMGNLCRCTGYHGITRAIKAAVA